MNKLLFITAIASAAIATPAVAAAAEYVPTIVAGVVRCDSWQKASDQAEGLYSIQPVAGAQLKRISKERDVYAAPMGGAVVEDGHLKGIHFRTIDDPMAASGYSYNVYSVEYDIKTGERIKNKSLGDLYGNLISGCGITKDPATGLNYGIFFNFDMDYNVIDRKFCTIDFSTAIPKKTQICVMTEWYAAIAAGPDGRLYGVNREGYLYTINKSTGRSTLIGDIGVTDISSNPSSMTFDPRTEKLYWCYVSKTNQSYLYEINYKVGEVGATKIMQLPDNAVLVNMYIAPPEADDAAPAACTNLKADFEGESYDGYLTFTLPSLAYDGEEMHGQLGYRIYDGQRLAKSGTGFPGERKQIGVKVDGGDTELKVVAFNDAGEGAPASISLYTGFDTPLPVTALKFVYDDAAKQAVVSWTAPVKGLHERELTPTNLTYNVVRRPDGVAVATGTAECTLRDNLPDSNPLKAYWYEVEPVNGGKMKGEVAASGKTVIGQPLNPPCAYDFTRQADYDIFTVIDANNDGATWERYHYTYTYSETTVDYARITASDEVADDDWLLMPPMTLEKGGIYEFKFAAKKQFNPAYCNQKVEVWAGQGTDPSKYKKLLGPVDVTDVNFADFDCLLSADAAGTWYVGLHAVSPKGSAALEIDRVSFTQIASGHSPAEVTDIEIVPDATGDLKADVIFTAPSKELSGEALKSLDRAEVRDGEGRLVGFSLNPVPGQRCTVHCSGIANGNNKFTIITISATNRSMPATAEAFIGQDVPESPKAVRLYDDGKKLMLSWEAPEKGANGLYLNPEKLKYNLYTIDDHGYTVLEKADITSPYDTGLATDAGEQTLSYYALRAESTGGVSEPVATNGVVIGAPYALPYTESFANASWPEKFCWLEGEYPDWNMGPTSGISVDNDGGAFIFTPNRAENGIFNLGKISLAGVELPVLTFDLYDYPGSLSTLAVAVDRFPQGVAETVAAYKFDNVQKEGWRKVAVNLSAFKQEPFVILKFAMAASSKETPVVIDNLYIGQGDSGIAGIAMPADGPVDIYSIDGRLVKKAATDFEGLQPGVYIAGGRKIYVAR